MNKKSLIALGLIVGFSANSVFAENRMANVEEYNKTIDRLTQAQRNANSASSDLNLAILNSRNILSKSKERKLVYTRNRASDEHRNNQSPGKKETRADVTGRKRTFTEKFNVNKKPEIRNPNRNTESDWAVSGNKRANKNNGSRLSKRDAKIYNLILKAGNLDQLTQEQRTQLLKLHKRMLKTKNVKILLATIQKGEDGGPLVIVGKGKGKSKEFKRIMNNLNFSTHPAYQFPKDMRCFYHNKQVGKCSTASGNYQITKTNFDYYKKYLGLKDFSVESQQIIALELMRTGRAKIVKGNYKGRGYVELVKGNLNNAIRYGTNDWASSPYSEWGGAKTPYIKYSETIAKNMKRQKPEKLKDQKYFQSWLDEVEQDNAS